jgi:hypothetical protein
MKISTKNYIKLLLIDLAIWVWFIVLYNLGRDVGEFWLSTLIITIGMLPANMVIVKALTKKYKDKESA